jgi:PKD repeat protein
VHFYSQPGTYTVVATARDKAGNETVVQKQVRIR